MPEIIEITDFNSKELDPYARLTEAELKHYYEPDGGLFIAESPKVVQRAIDAGYQPISMLVEKKHIDGEAREIVSSADIPVYTAEFDVLTKLTGFKLTRGMLCLMKRRSTVDMSDLCRNASRIAVLENVMNPTNVGAIFRSAAALGMDAVLLTKGCSDPLYRRSSRVSMGTVFQIPWTYAEDNWQEILAGFGFKTAAMALETDSVSIDDPNLNAEKKLAVVLGTEGDGLAASTITKCDYTVMIPMWHEVDSLNVAAASAVAFWQLGRKQKSCTG